MDGSTGRARRGGPPRTWRDDYAAEIDAGSAAGSRPIHRPPGARLPVRSVPRSRRPSTSGVLVPAWVSGQLARQLVYAGLILVLAAAAFRLPYDLGARLQAAAAAALTRDVDLEEAALVVRDAVQRGRTWFAQGTGGGEPSLEAVHDLTGSEPAHWIWPAAGVAVTGYGWTETGDGTVFHEGLDIAVALGAPVVAAASGTVARVWTDPEAGSLILELDHGGGWTSRYLHLGDVYVADGDPVVQGDVIAAVGEPQHGEQPNLHFEIRRRGSAVDPEPKLRRDEGSR